EALRDLGHLRTTAVDDHRLDPGGEEQRDVFGERTSERGAVHRCPAVLHDDHLSPMLSHVRQRLEEDPSLGDRALANHGGELVHVVYSALIRTYSYDRSLPSTLARPRPSPSETPMANSASFMTARARSKPLFSKSGGTRPATMAGTSPIRAETTAGSND